MTPLRIAAALAAAALAAPAAAFVRTTDRETGVELAWPVPVVTFRVNAVPGSLAPTCTATSADRPLQAVLAGFAAWEQSCSSLRLVYGGPTDEIRVSFDGTQQNVVVFRQGWCSNNPGALADPGGCLDDREVDCGSIYNCFEDQNSSDQGIVALTSVLYDPRTGRIMDADIEVNGWDGQGAGQPILASQNAPPAHGWYFTCGDVNGGICGGSGQPPCCSNYGDTGCSYIDLQNTLTHEVGHFIGLGHVPDSQTSATMHAFTAPGDVSKRTLAPDDVAGVCAIYPDGGDGGCGSAGGTGGLALLLAAAGLALLRRPSPAAVRAAVDLPSRPGSPSRAKDRGR